MSGYIDQNLQPGETVKYRGRPSKTAVLLRPTVLFVTFVILDSIDHSLTNSVSTTSTPGAKTGAEILLGFVIFFNLLAMIVSFIGALVFLNSAEYAVTDRRVVAKYGLIRRNVVDILLTRVSGVKVNQSAPGRMFGFGNVLVLASGANRQVAYVKNPQGFQSAILAQLEEARLLKGTAAYTLDVKLSAQGSKPRQESSPSPTSAPPLPPGTRAQWATDPFDQASLRYWDGDRWTDHVSPAP